MKQYCRYCSRCSYGDVCYCDAKRKTMSEEAAKKPNNCKDFDFNPLDVFDPEKEYKPREKPNAHAEQLKLF